MIIIISIANIIIIIIFIMIIMMIIIMIIIAGSLQPGRQRGHPLPPARDGVPRLLSESQTCFVKLNHRSLHMISKVSNTIICKFTIKWEIKSNAYST